MKLNNFFEILKHVQKNDENKAFIDNIERFVKERLDKNSIQKLQQYIDILIKLKATVVENEKLYKKKIFDKLTAKIDTLIVEIRNEVLCLKIKKKSFSQ